MAMQLDSYFGSFFLCIFCFSWFVSFPAEAAVRKYQFDIRVKNVSRLCHAKPIVTVNGRFPGPTIYAREGDRVLVNVKNYAQYNVSIHWHGLKQFRNGWADGPAYITQCPIKTGHSYTYDLMSPDNEEHCGGMHIFCGYELRFTGPSSLCRKKEQCFHSLNLIEKLR